jgi:hypothetical protein
MKKNVIAIVGKAQSGKTTAADTIRLALKRRGLSSKTYALADPLKDMCVSILGMSPAQCWGEDDFKNSETDFCWGDLPIGHERLSSLMEKMSTDKRKISKETIMLSREVLQVWGTDIFRYFLPDCWINSINSKINLSEFDYSIVSDVRFSNEINSLKDYNLLVFSLTRNIKKMNHRSENDLQNYDWSSVENYHLIDNANCSIENKNNKILDITENFIEINDNRASALKTWGVL